MVGCKEEGFNEPTPEELKYQETYKHDPIIKFIATADPQYYIKEMEANAGSVRNADSVSSIIADKINDQNYRGLIVAGDLTHTARVVEYEKYLSFIAPFEKYVYDGLGNHDFSWVGPECIDTMAFHDFGLDQYLSTDKIGWNSECLVIWEDVRERERIPAIYGSSPNLHYSWDWGDLHGIQLNVFPGTDHSPDKQVQHPMNSIKFLKEDLEKNVGQSGRPVILVHHYGFDYFSIGTGHQGGTITPEAAWWTATARRAYWDLIEPYNVIAIFTGHAHYCDACYLPWDGKNIGEEIVGENFIPTFISGAAREGVYLTCELSPDSLIVSRYRFEDQIFRKSFNVSRPTITRE